MLPSWWEYLRSKRLERHSLPAEGPWRGLSGKQLRLLSSDPHPYAYRRTPDLRRVDRSSVACLRVDADGVVVDWNRVMADLTGLSLWDVKGKTYAQLIAPLPISDAYRAAAIAWLRDPAPFAELLEQAEGGASFSSLQLWDCSNSGGDASWSFCHLIISFCNE